MAAPPISSASPLLFLASLVFQGAIALGIGVNYGRVANDLPPPSLVAQFLSQNTAIDRVKLYDSDPDVLRAFAGTNISLTVAIPNALVPDLASLPFAQRWVRAVLSPLLPSTNISRVLVGNEVLSTANRTLISSLVPALQSLHTALVGANLHGQIQVSTPHSLGILASSTPPSSGRFRPGYDTAVIKPLLSFLRATGGPFMVNAYPYFGSTTPDTLDYALFRATAGVLDSGTGLLYTNMFDAQLDAAFSAMRALGYGDVDVVVAETGWPSAGDAWQKGADVESARDYNEHLVRHCESGVGTPLMPNRTFEVYVFSLFNEDLKPGPASEKNFGLFRPDFAPVYDIGILNSGSNTWRAPPALASASAPPLNPMRENGRQWCVPRAHTDLHLLQANIDFVCGQGVDCRPIKPGGSCFFPDTVEAHAAFAMNEYYQTTSRSPFNCDFGQTGMLTTADPSYGSCKYN